MLLYFFVYFVVIILLLKSRGVDNNKQKNNIIFLFVMLSLALFVGMSDMLGGYDRYIYGELFDNMADIT